MPIGPCDGEHEAGLRPSPAQMGAGRPSQLVADPLGDGREAAGDAAGRAAGSTGEWTGAGRAALGAPC
jgi:hypothetical protein